MLQRVTLTDAYEILEPIGVGGSSVVYRAYQKSVDRHVALKVVKTSHLAPNAVARLENEARLIARLRHPNTIRLYDFGHSTNGEMFIVTELLQGRSLATILKAGPMRLDRALVIAEQVAGSLVEAHGAGVVHRDIKPENIFVDEVAGEEVVKVLDFGIARDAAAPRLTEPGMLVGSPIYMAPEQMLDEEIDHRADIYAFGAVLYHMLIGRPPFVGETLLEVVAMHLTRDAPVLWAADQRAKKTPAALAVGQLVAEMLEKAAGSRPQTMIEVRARVQRAKRLLDAPGRLPAIEVRHGAYAGLPTAIEGIVPLIDPRALPGAGSMAQLIDRMPRVSDARPVALEVRPQAIDARSDAIDIPRGIEARPAAIDTQPTTIDVAPPSFDGMPQVIDVMPRLVDAIPPVIDAMPPVIDAMPRVIDAMSRVDAMPPAIDAIAKIDAMPPDIDAMAKIDAMPPSIDAMRAAIDAVSPATQALAPTHALPAGIDVMPAADVRRAAIDAMSLRSEAIPAPREAIPAPREAIPAPREPMPAPHEPMPAWIDAILAATDSTPAATDIAQPNDADFRWASETIAGPQARAPARCFDSIEIASVPTPIPSVDEGVMKQRRSPLARARRVVAALDRDPWARWGVMMILVAISLTLLAQMLAD